MRDDRWGYMRNLLMTFGLLITALISSCAPAEERGFQDVLGLRGKGAASQSPVEFTATLAPDGKAGDVVLRISAKLPPDHYIYSTTPGQGAETKITIARAEGLEAIGDSFEADHQPEIVDDPDLGKTVEKYFKKVTWTKRYRVQAGVAQSRVSMAGLVNYQVCDKQSCRLEEYEFDVKLAAAKSAAPAPRATGTELVSTRFEHLYGTKGSQTVEATWTVSVVPRQVRPGDEVTITVRADLNPRWHVYPLDLPKSEDGGSLPTVIEVAHAGRLTPLGASFTGPAPLEKLPANGQEEIERYHEGRIEWTRKFKVSEDPLLGEIPLAGKVAWQMCNSTGFCLLATGFEFGGDLIVADEENHEPLALTVTSHLDVAGATEAIEELRPGAKTGTPPGEVDSARAPLPVPTRGTAETAGGKKQGKPRFDVQYGEATTARTIDKSQGLPFFLVTAVLAGFAALLTPCVFPMIPITVSFFQKQSEKEHHRPITMAAVYCLGIIGTYTGLGMLISVVFGAGALNSFSNDPWLNLFIAGILVFFGFNLLGMFEIRVPSWLLTYTAGKESRGGYMGVMFMALTFTLTSFTCTFAFLGLLLPAAAQGDWLWPILGLLTFSAAFSLPFFFLALFPSFLQKLPKSGGWMNVVKVVMGLIELGAAFKFLGTADQTWNGQPAFFDFHFMIAGWAVISVATALYLLGLFRLPHDMPADHIGVFRFITAISFLGFATYLGVGLFGADKPQGLLWRYVKAFASPKFEGGSDPSGPYLKHGDLKYALDFERAFEVAEAENKPLFLDFTGVNCTNCRFMEDGTMSQPMVEERLRQFVRIQLFVDSVPIDDKSEAERLKEFNKRLQQGWFGRVALPSYVVIPPDRLVLTDPSKILDFFEGVGKEAEFAQFLDGAWSKWQKVQAGRGGKVVSQR